MGCLTLSTGAGSLADAVRLQASGVPCKLAPIFDPSGVQLGLSVSGSSPQAMEPEAAIAATNVQWVPVVRAAGAHVPTLQLQSGRGLMAVADARTERMDASVLLGEGSAALRRAAPCHLLGLKTVGSTDQYIVGEAAELVAGIAGGKLHAASGMAVVAAARRSRWLTSRISLCQPRSVPSQ